MRTPTLEIAFETSGPADGIPVILLYGFPDDSLGYRETHAALEGSGCRVLAPWLRGFGPRRFLDESAPRSGQRAAIGSDLRELMDALRIQDAILVGYDWGGRAACIVAGLWPERCRGLITIGGYTIQNLSAGARPKGAMDEYRAWYQHYFNTERGVLGLEENRDDICRLLWQLWSPNWQFSDEAFERTATSFHNPDFVAVVIHSYHHRRGAAPGDPSLEAIERQLARRPTIDVPTVVLHGAADGVDPPPPDDGADAAHFTFTWVPSLA